MCFQVLAIEDSSSTCTIQYWLTNDSANQEEVGNGDGSQSDKQCNNNAARSTRRRKVRERYGR